MDLVRLLARADLHRHRWSVIVLGLSTVVIVGTLLTAAAGAHRTSTVLDRFLESANSSDTMVGFAWPALADDDSAVTQIVAELGALDGVRTVRAQAIGPIFAGTQFDMAVFTEYAVPGQHPSLSDRNSNDDPPPTDRPFVVRGRLPAADAGHEVALTEIAATQLDLDVGGVLTADTMSDVTADLLVRGEVGDDGEMLDGPQLVLDVVGVVRGTDDLSPTGSENPIALASPAFLDTYPDAARFGTLFFLQTEPARFDLLAARELIERRVPGNAEVFDGSIERDLGATRSAFDAIAVSLLVFAVVGAVVGLIVLVMVMLRHLQLGAVDRRAATALGATRRESTLAAAIPLVAATTSGAIAASVLAAALSPIFPYSIARQAEVDPGLRFDPLVHLGVATGVWIVLVAAALVCGRLATAPDRRIDAVPSTRLKGVRARLSPSVADGFSTVLGPRRRSGTVHPWTAIAGATIGVAGIIAIGTIEATRTDTVGDAERYGRTWDFVPDHMPDTDPLEVAGGLAADPRVDGVGGVFCGTPAIAGAPTQLCAFYVIDGSIAPVMLDGRAPSSPSEIALGLATADRLGVAIGDDVELDGEDGRPVVVQVSGTVVNTDVGDRVAPRDVAAVMTVEGFEQILGSIWEQPYSAMVIGVADGLDVESTAAAVAADHPITVSAYSFPQPPDKLIQLGRMRSSLVALGVFLGALGVIGLVHYLVLSSRRRRHEIAVLRALGFVRRQVCTSTIAQAVTVMVIGLSVGVPLGLIIGRWTWQFSVRDLGIIDTPVLPWAFVVPIAVAFLAGSAVLAWYPGRWATREQPSAALREE